MSDLLSRLAGGIVVGLLGLCALGLLIAAAVVGFSGLVGVGGALGIVGGILAVLALIVMLLARRRARRIAWQRTARGNQAGSFAAGFLLGVWEGLIRPRRRD